MASAGALDRQTEHSLDEHGISCLKYNSLTIFWTLPFFVDLTRTLLDIFAAWGSVARVLLRLVMIDAPLSLNKPPVLYTKDKNL